LCLETIAAVAQGLLGVVGIPDTDRKGRLYTMFRDFLSPLGQSDQSVKRPLHGPQGQGPCQSDKTQQSLSVSKCSCVMIVKNCIEEKTDLKNWFTSFMIPVKQTKERKKKTNKQKKRKKNSFKRLLTKNIFRGREG